MDFTKRARALGTHRAFVAVVGLVAFGVATMTMTARGGMAHASASSAELVQQARAHERARSDDMAVRRYTEAIALDPSDGDAYMGLGALRLRMGDAREAERVFTVALVRIPSLNAALAGRARARWALGMRDAAEREMQTYVNAEPDVAALRELAAWFGEDGLSPPQLAAWRAILTLAVQRADAALTKESRTMVRALQIMVGPADPATSPAREDAMRRIIANAAKRGE